LNERTVNYIEGHSVERMYLRQRPKSENWASLTPRSSATVGRTERSTGPAKLPGPWTTTWSKQYLSAVHPVTCSLLWVRCLLDRIRQIFDFQILRFLQPDYDPDRAQKLTSSSMSRHLSTRKISSKFMHAFWSNLANRQTDRQTSRAIAYTSSFVGGEWKCLCLCRLLKDTHSSSQIPSEIPVQWQPHL